MENTTQPLKLRQDPLFALAVIVALLKIIYIGALSPAVAERLLYVNVPQDLLNTYQGILSGIIPIPSILLVPLYGWLMDRFGRRRVITPLLLIFGLSAPMIFFITTFEQLLVLTLLQEAVSSAFFWTTIILLGDKYEGLRMSEAVGANATIGSIARIVSPIIGGFITEIDFRLMYLFFLSALPVAILVNWGLKKYGARVFLSQEEKETTQKVRLLPWIREHPGLIGIYVIGFMIPFVMISIAGGFHQIYLREVLGVSATLRGMLISVLWGSRIITTTNLGRLSKRLSTSQLFTLGYSFYAIGGVWIILTTTFETIIPGFVIFGLGHGIVPTLMTSLSADLAPAGQKAIVISSTGVLTSLSRSTVSLIGGPLIDQTSYQYFASFTILIVITYGIGSFLSPYILRGKMESPSSSSKPPPPPIKT
ncbi:MAG: MFS transporter [Candidatus Ranarchaeia archaeon]|jgi:MFS family permease